MLVAALLRPARRVCSRPLSTVPLDHPKAALGLRGWYLPAGSRVKHGTTSDALSSILQHGLKPSGEVVRLQGRDKLEDAPESSGVYVSSCHGASAACYRNFSAQFYHHAKSWCPDAASAINELLRLDATSNATFDLFPGKGTDDEKLRVALRKARMLLTRPDAAVRRIGVPIVVNATLQEDCRTGASDEDYLNCLPDWQPAFTAAGPIWSEFGSAAIVRSIPPGWISSVEYPELSERYPTFDSHMRLLDSPVEEWRAIMKQLKARKISFKRATANVTAALGVSRGDALSEQRFDEDLALMVYSVELSQAKPAGARALWPSKLAQYRIFGTELTSGPCDPALAAERLCTIGEPQSAFATERDLYGFCVNLFMEVSIAYTILGTIKGRSA